MTDDTRGAPPQELLFRTTTIGRDTLDARKAGDDSIPIAISSETPVERWFGTEILSHDAAAVDLSRASKGLPLLMDHDTGTHIGIVRDIRLGADKVLRGRMQFGNHPDAAWIRKDVEDGIRTEISVGYRINSWDDTRSDAETFVAGSWTPMEVSSVPVPADASVGVGRAAGVLRAGDSRDGEAAMELKASRTAADVRKELLTIYRMAAEHGLTPEDAANAVERSLSPEQFAGEILDRNVGRANTMPTPGGHMDLTPRDAARYNREIGAGLSALAGIGNPKDAGSVFAVSSEIAKRLGRDPSQLHIPLDIGTRTSLTGQIAGTSSLGGVGIQSTIMPMIDILRNNMKVREAGATIVTGLTGNAVFPRKLTTNTLAWTGENQSTPHALTQMTFDSISLSPKVAMAGSAFSRQSAIQMAQGMENVVLNDLAAICALGIDDAAINGLGSANQPRGIRNTSGITSKTLGSHGSALTWADVVSVETSISASNATDLGSISWLVNSVTRGKLKSSLRNTVSGSAYIWGDDATLNSYRALTTNALPSNITKGTSTTVCSSALFGVFSELMVGEFGGAVSLLVDPYVYASQNMLAVWAFMHVDCAVRHPAAFAEIPDILTA
jgi:HK97 family phage major capsid protein/HK97 family phage prohead protease